MNKCLAYLYATCVAMAELIAGSESEFVARMNARAKELGMNDTNFVNCCGLDIDGHMTTAYDVALMSRELIEKYPQIHDYCTIWMENITHVTAKGSSEFGLTNTNKLIRQYPYATGLKTGSTGLAKYCVSATAKKDDLELIAVIMAAPDHKIRFNDASTLLNYGFSKCQIYTDENTDKLSPVKIKRGTAENVSVSYAGPFRYVNTKGDDLSTITKEIQLKKEVNAPIKKDDIAGKAVYKLNGVEVGSVSILYDTTIPKATLRDYFSFILKYFLT